MDLTSENLLTLTPFVIGQGIIATTVISGSQRQFTATTFTGDNGPFVPEDPLALSPAQPSLPPRGSDDIILMSGKQRLVINFIDYLPPTVRSEGFVHLKCGYSDPNGNNGFNFEGDIGYWPLTETNTCPAG